jgi:hypothetical protein
MKGHCIHCNSIRPRGVFQFFAEVGKWCGKNAPAYLVGLYITQNLLQETPHSNL